MGVLFTNRQTSRVNAYETHTFLNEKAMPRGRIVHNLLKVGQPPTSPNVPIVPSTSALRAAIVCPALRCLRVIAERMIAVADTPGSGLLSPQRDDSFLDRSSLSVRTMPAMITPLTSATCSIWVLL